VKLASVNAGWSASARSKIGYLVALAQSVSHPHALGARIPVQLLHEFFVKRVLVLLREPLIRVKFLACDLFDALGKVLHATLNAHARNPL
jgi:hypothetical protein